LIYSLNTNIYYEKFEEISDMKIFMILRATENAAAGHMWPAGRYLLTPAIYQSSL